MSPALGNTQIGPWPQQLAVLIENLTYKPGWEFEMHALDRGQGSEGLTLIITITTPDSYLPATQTRTVQHYFPVPPAGYDARSWRRWLFEQILAVERHEAMEFFTVAGDKPYAPSHGPGNDPYLIREVGTDTDRRTSDTGELSEQARL
jgi:hypothetical protein